MKILKHLNNYKYFQESISYLTDNMSDEDFPDFDSLQDIKDILNIISDDDMFVKIQPRYFKPNSYWINISDAPYHRGGALNGDGGKYGNFAGKLDLVMDVIARLCNDYDIVSGDKNSKDCVSLVYCSTNDKVFTMDIGVDKLADYVDKNNGIVCNIHFEISAK